MTISEPVPGDQGGDRAPVFTSPEEAERHRYGEASMVAIANTMTAETAYGPHTGDSYRGLSIFSATMRGIYTDHPQGTSYEVKASARYGHADSSTSLDALAASAGAHTMEVTEYSYDSRFPGIIKAIGPDAFSDLAAKHLRRLAIGVARMHEQEDLADQLEQTATPDLWDD